MIAMDVFSRMLSFAQDINLFKGIKLSRRSPFITHLLFADVVMFFFHASPNASLNMRDVISSFSKVSRQVINYSKSSITFSPNIVIIHETTHHGLLQLFGSFFF